MALHVRHGKGGKLKKATKPKGTKKMRPYAKKK